jgi:Holliday junction resolvase
MTHYPRKRDANDKDIAKELRARGYRVFDTASFGDGFPDKVVMLKNGRVALLFEIKPETGGKVTKDECKFMMQIVEPVYRMIDNAEQADAVLQSVEMSNR